MQASHDPELDRRAILAGGLGALGGMLVTGARADARVRAFQDAVIPREPRNARTLVLVQLTGGNDALSMVVPHGDDGYNRARSSTRIEKGEVARLDDYRGLNPNLVGLKAAWDDGRVAIVEGCGYPHPIRSHFQSFDVWHTASEQGRVSGDGWIGRLCDAGFDTQRAPEKVVHVGGTPPYALFSRTHPPLAFSTPATYRWVGSESEDMQAYRRAAEEDSKELARRAGKSGQDAALEKLRGVLEEANASSLRVRRAVAEYVSKSKYPEDDFGESLRVAAALIDARVGTRVVSVELSGFDTHQNQRPQHDALMRRLDGGLRAFLEDMKSRAVGADVVVVVFSEFGRRVKENGSRGTDHGVAAPMLVLGNRVAGGLYGRHPSFEDLDDGDLAFTTDFRSVYATIVERWFGVEHPRVLGATYPLLPFLKT